MTERRHTPMARIQIVSTSGRVKDSFESDIDPESASDALSILRKSKFPAGSIRVQQRNKSWKTYRPRT
jgi:hypothetical protein